MEGVDLLLSGVDAGVEDCSNNRELSGERMVWKRPMAALDDVDIDINAAVGKTREQSVKMANLATTTFVMIRGIFDQRPIS